MQTCCVTSVLTVCIKSFSVGYNAHANIKSCHIWHESNRITKSITSRMHPKHVTGWWCHMTRLYHYSIHITQGVEDVLFINSTTPHSQSIHVCFLYRPEQHRDPEIQTYAYANTTNVKNEHVFANVNDKLRWFNLVTKIGISHVSGNLVLKSMNRNPIWTL